MKVAEQITQIEEQLEKYKESQDSTAPVVIAALEAELQKLKELQDKSPATPDQEEEAADQLNQAQAGSDSDTTLQTLVVIDQAKKQAMEFRFSETINNPRFWAKESRFETVMSALVVPVFDDRSLQQYYFHSESDLIANAASKSSAGGVPVVMPTVNQIIAEVWRRWVASETECVTKALNKQRRDESKKNGTKFIPVPPGEVLVLVADAEAKLRASENC
jgi:hypothetical protein